MLNTNMAADWTAILHVLLFQIWYLRHVHVLAFPVMNYVMVFVNRFVILVVHHFHRWILLVDVNVRQDTLLFLQTEFYVRFYFLFYAHRTWNYCFYFKLVNLIAIWRVHFFSSLDIKRCECVCDEGSYLFGYFFLSCPIYLFFINRIRSFWWFVCIKMFNSVSSFFSIRFLIMFVCLPSRIYIG
jgi:hypothetical protein